MGRLAFWKRRYVRCSGRPAASHNCDDASAFACRPAESLVTHVERRFVLFFVILWPSLLVILFATIIIINNSNNNNNNIIIIAIIAIIAIISFILIVSITKTAQE